MTNPAVHIISDQSAIVSHECQYPLLPSKINDLMVKYASLPIVNDGSSSSWNDTADCYITSNILNGFDEESIEEIRALGSVFDLSNGTQLVAPCKKILVFGNINTQEPNSTQFFSVEGSQITLPSSELISIALNSCGNSDGSVINFSEGSVFGQYDHPTEVIKNFLQAVDTVAKKPYIFHPKTYKEPNRVTRVWILE